MIAVIDYGMGNLHSICKSLEYLGAEVVLTENSDVLKRAKKIVLPGVGAFSDGIRQLRNTGMDKALYKQVIVEKKPFLGICLGMQLITKKSYEFGEYVGLGFIDAEVKRFNVDEKNDLPVPHVGWNNIELKKNIPLFSGIKNNSDFYFVHSYYVVCNDDSDIVATCEYGTNFVAALSRENIFAIQFHPEKSQIFGLNILQNFVEM